MRDDGALNVFMTEPNFEAWRKRVKVSTEEESSSKRLTPAQEMAIPADLEEKLE
jgi:sorting nexin-8